MKICQKYILNVNLNFGYEISFFLIFEMCIVTMTKNDMTKKKANFISNGIMYKMYKTMLTIFNLQKYNLYYNGFSLNVH